MNKKNIFISYAVEDAERVRKIKRDIEALDHIIWIYPQAIDPGFDIIKNEKEGIENCDVVLFMTSVKSQASTSVKKEITFAKRLEKITGKKKTYIVRIDPSASLDDTTIQKSDLSHPETYTSEFCRLMRSIENSTSAQLLYDIAEDSDSENWSRVRLWVEGIRPELIKNVDYHLHPLLAKDGNTKFSNRDKQMPFKVTFYTPNNETVFAVVTLKDGSREFLQKDIETT